MKNLPIKIVIVGTDTEIGKTHIACEIIKKWQQQGISKENILAIKPLVSGSIDDINEKTPLKWDDIERLKNTNINVEYFYGFQPAISPDAAALLSNPVIHLSASNIVQKTQKMMRETSATHIIIEGAGGVFLPLNDYESFLDVLVALKLPVILIVGMKLGGINHALLTMEALLNRKVVIAGWVANYLPQHQTPFYMLERLQQRFSQQGIYQLQLD